MFNKDEFTVFVGLPVLLGFSCFGAQTFPVGCAHASVNDGVLGWLLHRRIVRSAVPRSKGCSVLYKSQLALDFSPRTVDGD